MAGVNKVFLIGNLGKNPEIVNFENAKKAAFPLATTESFKNRDGQKVEQTEWHNIVCWRGLADIAERLLQKGTQVYIEGKLRTRSWEDKEGHKRYTTEIVAENFMILNNRNNNAGSSLQDDAIIGSEIGLDTNDTADLPF